MYPSPDLYTANRCPFFVNLIPLGNMKKTKKIQLVLITAALASCNRTLYPTQPDPGYTPDPVYYDAARQTSDSTFQADSCTYDNYYYPYYYTGTYYPSWPFHFFLGLRPVYKSRNIVRRPGFIARGGFGKIGVTAVS
jgi:hypothetical protein